MNNITNLIERNKNFEEAHYSCKELLDDRINKIEKYVTKWLLYAIAGTFIFTASGFIYFHYKYIDLKKKVDHRYFQIEEMMEDIHKVKIDNGNVTGVYK